MNSKVFMKGEKCPICGQVTKQPQFKAKSFRLVSTDYDLYTHYDGINPVLYSAKLCNHCGYANLANIFEKPGRKFIAFKKERETNTQWKPWEIPEVNDIDYAIKLHKLVLMNYMNSEGLYTGELAYICLKLYWLYNQKDNELEAVRFRRLALEKFKECYSTQEFPIFQSVDNTSVMYWIAVFSYYDGDIETCKRWLSLVFQEQFISTRLKAKARDFKEEFLK